MERVKGSGAKPVILSRSPGSTALGDLNAGLMAFMSDNPAQPRHLKVTQPHLSLHLAPLALLSPRVERRSCGTRLPSHEVTQVGRSAHRGLRAEREGRAEGLGRLLVRGEPSQPHPAQRRWSTAEICGAAGFRTRSFHRREARMAASPAPRCTQREEHLSHLNPPLVTSAVTSRD
jgi:hypothetical protein